MNAYEILVRPVVTEKSARLAQENRYVFIIRDGVTKIDVARAVADLYKVKVTAVRTVTRHAKRKRRGARWAVKSGSRRAIVSLAAGQQLDVTAGT